MESTDQSPPSIWERGATLSARWAALPGWLQTLIAFAGCVGAIWLGSYRGLDWVEEQSALGPRMDRVERIAVADSARNVHQDAEILALQRGQDSAAADRATTRVIAFETYRTVLAMLCRDDGRSPSQCDEESLRKARETLGDYAP